MGTPGPDVLAHLAEGIAVLTAHHGVMTWSPAAETLTGYTREGITAVGLVQVFEPLEVMQQIVRTAQEGTPTIGERLHLRRADGRQVPVSVQCLPLPSLGDGTGGVVVAIRDVSDLEALQHRHRDSEQLRLLGRLAGAVSHEIRNPLNALFLHTDILEEELSHPHSGDHKQFLRSLTMVREAGARLEALVQDYLSLAHLIDVRYEPEEWGAFLETLGRELQGQLATRNITLRLEGFAGLGQVALHAPTFRRAVLNLLQYVVDTLAEGGTLTLRGRRAHAQAHLDINSTDSEIPEDQLTHLCNPLNPTQPQGKGLGLYLVREIVVAHHGELTVIRAPGLGTTFTVTLPLLAAQGAPEG